MLQSTDCKHDDKRTVDPEGTKPLKYEYTIIINEARNPDMNQGVSLLITGIIRLKPRALEHQPR